MSVFLWPGQGATAAHLQLVACTAWALRLHIRAADRIVHGALYIVLLVSTLGLAWAWLPLQLDASAFHCTRE